MKKKIVFSKMPCVCTVLQFVCKLRSVSVRVKLTFPFKIQKVGTNSKK